jgi:predicted DNA-binding transcriptional regulator AlpA
MSLERQLKEIIKAAVREVIEEQVTYGRLQPQTKTVTIVESKPPTSAIHQTPRDPNFIIRPTALSEMLSVSLTTLWRWEKLGRLPGRMHLGGRAVGWRYGDIEEWLHR